MGVPFDGFCGGVCRFDALHQALNELCQKARFQGIRLVQNRPWLGCSRRVHPAPPVRLKIISIIKNLNKTVVYS